MRILLLTDGLPPTTLGGTGNIVWQMARSLQQRGHEVHLLSVSKQPVILAERDHILCHELPARGLRWSHYRSVFSGKRRGEILRIIDEVKPDIIHAHSIAMQLGYTWIAPARKRGVPVIMTSHDVMHVAYGRVLGSETTLWRRDFRRARWTWNPFRAAIIRSTLNRHAIVLTVSDALRSFMERFGFTNLTTIHNGIDTDFWTPQEKGAARRSLQLPEDKTLFLLAGRLGLDKGTDLIAKTLPKNALLVLAGHAPLAEFQEIKDQIRFFPNQGPEQMRTLYAACDAVLVPSRCLDCFPTVCLEGMSCARPILATSWGGAKEAVVDHETGWILDPNDRDAWAKQMQFCIDHPEECTRLGLAGRKYMEQSFPLPHFITTMENYYSDALRANTKE